jgi:Protein of unknown function (DUF2786)
MTENREGLFDKIRASLSKTTENGCTEAEHLAALAKARALMDAYEVTEADLQLAKEEGVIMRKDSGKDPHGIKFNLSRSVGDFWDCKAWRDRDDALVFLGLTSDVQLGTWLLDHLTSFVLVELTKHLMGDVAIDAKRRQVINGFVDGVTWRISERLQELCKKPPATVSANSRALVVAKQAMIKTKLDELGVHFRSCGGSSRQHDAGSFAAGRSAGDKASFGRPVSGRAGTLRIGGK